MTAIEPNYEATYTFAREHPFALDCGAELQPVSLHYAVYGELNAARDNAVLVCHALSGSARVGDWWTEMLEGAFDLERDCVIGSNVLGSCYGSTGPSSVNPSTGQPFGPEFPVLTIRDMVRAQSHLLSHLGIERLRMVIGGSIGGQQALRWAIDYPGRVERCVAIGATPLGAMGLALNHVQRQAVRLDPTFNGGCYADPPRDGLALARAIAMCSYKSASLFARRFGRQPDRSGEEPNLSLAARFDVAGYLDYQGDGLAQRFDANSYLVLSRAMDLFDLATGYGSEAEALRRITADLLLVGISSDWLFPAGDVSKLARQARREGAQVTYRQIRSDHGHDAFLSEPAKVAELLSSWLDREHAETPAVSTDQPLDRSAGGKA